MPWSDAAGLRRNNLDLFRLILASGVLFSHSYAALGLIDEEPLQHWTHSDLHTGRLCVFGFFAISGFLIAASWDRTQSLVAFTWHRALRILPAFFCVTFVVAFIVAPLGAGPDAPPVGWSRLVNVVTDALRFRSRVYSGCFVGNPAPTTFNVSVWTVNYEVRCYAMVALIGLIPLLPRKLATLLGCAAFIAATCVDESILPSAIVPVWKVIALPWVAWFPLAIAFSEGMLLYRFRDKVPYSNRLAALSLFGFAGCLCFHQTQALGLALFGGYLFFYLAFNERTLCPDLARNYGDASYGAFLYGFPIQQLLIHYLGTGMGPLGLFALALPLSLLAGWLSWHLVEKRFMRLKDRGPGRRR